MNINDIFKLRNTGREAIEKARQMLVKEGYGTATGSINGLLSLNTGETRGEGSHVEYDIPLDAMAFRISSIFCMQDNTLYDPQHIISCSYRVKDDNLLYDMCKAKGIAENFKDFESFCNRIEYETTDLTPLDRITYETYKEAVRIALTIILD